MELTLLPNPLYAQTQTLHIDKVATLIGENGSGKSSILKSVFDAFLNNQELEGRRVICFSSGQNEGYSANFGKFLNKQRRKGNSLSLNAFYFDKSWSKILIFLATATKRHGKVRSYLLDRDYLDIDQTNLDDLTTKLECSFRVDRRFVLQVQDALNREENGELQTLRSTAYFRVLDSFISNLIDSNYDFDNPLPKKKITIEASRLINVSFQQAPTLMFAESLQGQNAILGDYFSSEVSFFIQAADNNYFIDRTSCKLLFKNALELDDLSDGEYQLLFLYALIDLFDADNTLFLLDEVDSHLHYKNVEKLWSLLHAIRGHAITTTHLIDSISAKENRIEHLKVVDSGRINEENKVKQLIGRLRVLARANSTEFEVIGKIPNVVVMDDYNDWLIFTKLAERCGYDISRISQLHAVKKTSSYTTDADILGSAKVEWVKGLLSVGQQINTARIFLICDRDEAHPNWHDDGVQLKGKKYTDLVKSLKSDTVKTFFLVWKRREIKNYLLSFSALFHYGILNQVNNSSIAGDHYLQANSPADNDSIRKFKAKDIVDPLINSNTGLDVEKLQNYISLIPPAEISEDITNMYNFIIGKL